MSTRLARLALLALAAWGLIVSLLVASGRVPLGLWPAPAGARQTKPEEPCVCPDRKPGDTALPAPALPAAGRYAVCDREETPAKLFELGVGSPALWAVHCGPSVHVIAFEAGQRGLSPRRVALLRAPHPSQVEAPRPGPIAAADLDADGLADLLVSLPFVDRAGAPSGGALYLLRGRAEGGFAPPARLLDAAASAVSPAQLDGQPGSDLILLHLQDEQTGRTNELWFVNGGPAPLRSARVSAGVGARSLATLDLDLDRIDDAVVLAASAPHARVWLSTRAGDEPLSLELQGAREALASDLDGDGVRELLVVGAQLWLVAANKDSLSNARSLGAADSLRDIQVLDVNGDTRPDIVGYAHPALVAWIQRDALRFERRNLASVRGPLGVLAVRAASLGAGAAPDLVLLATGSGAEQQVELVVEGDLEAAPVSLLAANAAHPVQDSALTQRFDLP